MGFIIMSKVEAFGEVHEDKHLVKAAILIIQEAIPTLVHGSFTLLNFDGDMNVIVACSDRDGSFISTFGRQFWLA